MSDIEIGRAKRAKRAYAFDDIAIVPSRRTRDPQDVSVNWTIDAFTFSMPVLAAPMDSVVSPATAIAIGQLGGLGVLDLEGVWTRYDDPAKVLKEIRGLKDADATKRMQAIYAEPIKPALIKERLAEIRASGVPVAGALSPQRTQEHYKTVVDAGVDLFVIRGTTVSAEHVSKTVEPLNLKKFIYELDVPVIVGGAATYTAALHLMRTGAAGVLVGFGGGAASHDAQHPRHPRTDGDGGRRCRRRSPRLPRRVGRPLRARHRRRRPRHQRRHRQGDLDGRRRRHARLDPRPRRRGARRRLALGLGDAPRRAAPRHTACRSGTVAPLEQLLFGPAETADGRVNLIGALKRSMATTGYSDLKEFQRVEVVIAPVPPGLSVIHAGIPVLRVFDEQIARRFYVEALGHDGRLGAPVRARPAAVLPGLAATSSRCT